MLPVRLHRWEISSIKSNVWNGFWSIQKCIHNFREQKLLLANLLRSGDWASTFLKIWYALTCTETCVDIFVALFLCQWWRENSFGRSFAETSKDEWTFYNSTGFQATTGASKMVKSKSMEVMKAVQEDLGEVKIFITLLLWINLELLICRWKPPCLLMQPRWRGRAVQSKTLSRFVPTNKLQELPCSCNFSWFAVTWCLMLINSSWFAGAWWGDWWNGRGSHQRGYQGSIIFVEHGIRVCLKFLHGLGAFQWNVDENVAGMPVRCSQRKILKPPQC